MAVLKHIGPASVFKVALCLYFLVGVIMAAVFYYVALLTGPNPFLVAHGAALIAVPFLYAVVGAIAAVIAAFCYNLVAGWVGGLKIELD